MNIKWDCVYRVFGANMAQGLSLGECQFLSLALYVAHGLHRPRTYPQLTGLEKIGFRETASSFHNLHGYWVCSSCSGKPFGYCSKRASRRGSNKSPISCFLFSKLKGNIEKMSSRITFTVVPSLDIKSLGEFRPSRSVSAFMCGNGNGSRLGTLIPWAVLGGTYLMGLRSSSSPRPLVQCWAPLPSAGRCVVTVIFVVY